MCLKSEEDIVKLWIWGEKMLSLGTKVNFRASTFEALLATEH